MPGVTKPVRTRLTLGLLTVLAASSAARGGDEAMIPDSRLGVRVAPLLLLGRPDVRADLGLSPHQVESARRAITQLYERALESRTLTGPEALSIRRGIDESQRRWIETELTPEQQARLDQIDLQWEGPSALATRTGVAETMGLSAEQLAALRRAIGRRDGARGRQGPRVEADKELAREALTILSAEQRDRWLAMLGPPFVPRVATSTPARTRR